MKLTSLYHLGRFIEDMSDAKSMFDKVLAADRLYAYADQIQNEMTAWYQKEVPGVGETIN